jgi:hypothetical protein
MSQYKPAFSSSRIKPQTPTSKDIVKPEKKFVPVVSAKQVSIPSPYQARKISSPTSTNHPSNTPVVNREYQAAESILRIGMELDNLTKYLANLEKDVFILNINMLLTYKEYK